MATVSGSFTAVGLSAVLDVPAVDEEITISLTGTWVATVRLERELSPYSNAWEVIRSDTGNYSIVIQQIRKNERYRFNTVAFTSGTVTFSVSDGDAPVSSDTVITTTEAGAAIAGTLSVTGDTTLSGDLTVDGGDILSSSGAIAFGDETLTTTGAVATGALTVTGAISDTSASTFTTGATIGNVTIADGSITDSGGTISFGNENLSTTGTINSVPVEDGQTVDPSQKVTLFDDFFQFDTNLWSDGEGSDDVAVGPAISAGALNGEITAVSGDADNAAGSFDVSGTCGNGLHWLTSNGGLVMEARVKVNTAANTSLFVGFTDAVLADGSMEAPLEASGSGDVITAEADDAAGMIYDTDFATNPTLFNMGSVNNTSVTTVVVGATTAADDTYVIIRVSLTASGTLEVFVNGTSVGTISSAITTSDALTPCVLVRGRTTATRTVTIDYIWCQQDRT